MKILVALNHPAHYYLFKYTIINLTKLGHEVKYVIKQKDVLEKILICENVNYVKINKKRNRRSSAVSVLTNGITELIIHDTNLLLFAKKWRPALMIGTDVSITHIGYILRIPSFVFNEDDYEINKLFCKMAYPFATKIFSPNVCSVGKYVNKKIEYNGFQKMAYLHPKYFRPDRSSIENIVGKDETYFIIRIVSFTSGHDIEKKRKGLDENVLDRIIEELSQKGKVFITSESNLHPKYWKFKIDLNPNKIHHLIAYATILIGDSQTMCAEAGLLGTPFIRYNDFVGKISVLNEIENTYKMGFGIKTDDPNIIFEKIKYLLSIKNIKETWWEKKTRLFADKVDVTQYYTDYIDNYLKFH